MTKREDRRATLRRIKKAEDDAHAKILRAFNDVIGTLQKEATEYRIRLAERQRIPNLKRMAADAYGLKAPRSGVR